MEWTLQSIRLVYDNSWEHFKIEEWDLPVNGDTGYYIGREQGLDSLAAIGIGTRGVELAPFPSRRGFVVLPGLGPALRLTMLS